MRGCWKLKFGKLLLLSALVATACDSSPQPQPVAVPASWTRVTVVPASGTPERNCAGLLDTGWALSSEGNTLKARIALPPQAQRDALPYEIDYTGAIDEPQPPPPYPDGRPRPRNDGWAIGYARDHARRAVLTVDDGWFVAFDAGEYGGSLWWYPRQPGPGRKIWDQNVRWLMRRGADVRAFSKVSALDKSEGVLLDVTRSAERGWGIGARHSLLREPWALTEDTGGRLIVITRSSVELVQGDSVTVLARVEFPDLPSSVLVTPGGAIAVPFRMFVHVLQPQNGGYRSEWYIPPRCLTFEMRDFDCVCTGRDGA
ncbi:MAG TPA: hypothetical protein VGQ37_12575 [Vicinamibacterales bacterium]|jgi:hypothetical protein|nr:hypothetical protein [Vicinamibacterales bacterium]